MRLLAKHAAFYFDEKSGIITHHDIIHPIFEKLYHPEKDMVYVRDWSALNTCRRVKIGDQLLIDKQGNPILDEATGWFRLNSASGIVLIVP